MRDACSPIAWAISLAVAWGVSVRYCKISALRCSAMQPDYRRFFIAIFSETNGGSSVVRSGPKLSVISGVFQRCFCQTARMLGRPLPARSLTLMRLNILIRDIARVGHAAYQRLLHIDAERARVGDADAVRPFLHHQAPAVVVAGMDQRVGQRFLPRAAVVPLAVAAVGAGKRVRADVDRLVVPVGPWHLDDHDAVALALPDLHVLIREDVHIGDSTVVDAVPEVRRQPLRVGQRHAGKALAGVFDHTQQDVPAEGVGKGRIGLSDAVRQSALGALGFQAVVLLVLAQVGKVQHGGRLFFPL